MQKKVLFIGMDAAEPRLIEKWINDGSLPNLKKLYGNGVYKRTVSTEKIISDPWITVYTGANIGEHGFYNDIIWVPETMNSERMHPIDVGAHPFWHKFDDKGPRTIVVDVPMSSQSVSFNGLELYGWANHDVLTPFYTSPPELKANILDRFGPPPFFREKYAPHSGSELIKMKDNLVQATDSAAKLAKYLIENEPWDLFMVVFGATHRGGHKLWDQSCIDSGEDEATKKVYSTALKEIYQVCDGAVGELISSVDENTTILVFSPHGMGPNTSRNDILPDMISKIITEKSNTGEVSQRPKSLSAVRQRIPLAWRDAIKNRLPTRIQDSLTKYWRTGGIDWAATPAFSVVASDLVGLIRINLKGREAQGIIQPGEEYEFWINKITEGLHTFVDADTGSPIVSKVLRKEQLDLEGKRVEYLPDLFVIWDNSPAANHREIKSLRYGSIPWPTPYKNPDGRCGNHLPEGFLLAVGQDFSNDFIVPEIKIQDIPATIHDLLGMEIPPNIIGKSLI
jgi:predicted AlkP superfamily phosphohydrolase/phosphomutase